MVVKISSQHNSNREIQNAIDEIEIFGNVFQNKKKAVPIEFKYIWRF